MFGIPDFLVKPLIGFLIASALAVAGYFAWQHYVAEPYRAQGRAQEAKRLQPVIEAQTKRLEADIAAFREIEKAFTAINANSERLKKAAAQAQKVKIVRQVEERERVKEIEKIVLVGGNECELTSDAIDRAFRGGP